LGDITAAAKQRYRKLAAENLGFARAAKEAVLREQFWKLAAHYAQLAEDSDDAWTDDGSPDGSEADEH
jgi:hypothetical protein